MTGPGSDGPSTDPPRDGSDPPSDEQPTGGGTDDSGHSPDDERGETPAHTETDDDSVDGSRVDTNQPDTRQSAEQPTGRPAETAGGQGTDPAPTETASTEMPETAVEGAATGETNSGGDSSPPKPATSNGVTIEDDGVVRWFFKTDNGTVVAVRDVLSSVAIVAVIGLLLFGISGVWPPLVAVESGSMEPNMHKGDLIFVADENRFTGDNSVDGTGVVPLADAGNSEYEKFGEPGDVIIFMPNGNDRATPIIHRAHFWVEEGEDWVEKYADPEYTNGRTCDQIRHCPANHAGFITKGDNPNTNSVYDQAGAVNTDVVAPEWITGKGMFRVPWLGHVRLTFDRYFSAGPGIVTATPDGEPTAGTPDYVGQPLPPSEHATTAVGIAGGVGVGTVAIAGWRRYGR
ncbi:S26 family signal peptidase [Natronobiforma cellulositropha]|uniref:S26 family signal peptidase n=1 Tax=Natronobiforma cellulositropha TaxID=1679076 RepID=UPI0021D5AB84|nr:S26 family signal peptidase [Natronobiforma cellulositropha]